jgi:hypothetical protein
LQPFTEIGGDPAPSKGKFLIIDYRSGGALSRLALKEQYPDAFTVVLPSSDAVAPGSDPEATAFMQDAQSHIKWAASAVGTTWQDSHTTSHMNIRNEWWAYLGYSITIVSMMWAIAATIQLRRVKKQLSTRT